MGFFEKACWGNGWLAEATVAVDIGQVALSHAKAVVLFYTRKQE